MVVIAYQLSFPIYVVNIQVIQLKNVKYYVFRKTHFLQEDDPQCLPNTSFARIENKVFIGRSSGDS